MTEVLGTNAIGHSFYLIALIASVLLLCFFKGKRLQFVLPATLMGLMIANPVFKHVWESKLHLGYYWRILWIVPVIPLCAALPSMIAGKIKNIHLKGIVAIAFAAVYALTGSYMYTHQYCEFIFPSPNTAKLPASVVKVAEYLLHTKQNPRIIADASISIYIRQYSGEIETLFGRDIEGYIIGPSEEARKVDAELRSENGDMGLVAQIMLNYGYDYLITKDTSEAKRTSLEQNGFELERRVDDYGVYTAHGNPTEKRERNELGQVISLTYLDNNGDPSPGAGGFASVSYEYNTYGDITKVFHTDADGNGVADEQGIAGYMREFDAKGHLLIEIWISPEGKAVFNTNTGYAKVKREYKADILVKETLYDENGLEIKSKQ